MLGRGLERCEPIIGPLQVLIPADLVGSAGREAFLQGGHPREEGLHEASQRLHALVHLLALRAEGRPEGCHLVVDGAMVG